MSPAPQRISPRRPADPKLEHINSSPTPSDLKCGTHDKCSQMAVAARDIRLRLLEFGRRVVAPAARIREIAAGDGWPIIRKGLPAPRRWVADVT